MDASLIISEWMHRMGKSETYELRMEGHLSPGWSSWFEGLTLTHTDKGETVLRGQIPDQCALHGILMRIRDLGLPLVAVTRLPESDVDHQA
jgi:hypothetical protein